MSHRYFGSYSVGSSGWNSYYRSHISGRRRWGRRRRWNRRWYTRRSYNTCTTSSYSEC